MDPGSMSKFSTFAIHKSKVSSLRALPSMYLQYQQDIISPIDQWRATEPTNSTRPISELDISDTARRKRPQAHT